MRFHLTSFLLGFGAGAATVIVGRHLRPALVEVVTGAYELMDAAAARVAMVREDVDDVFAEARARARGAQREEPVRATA